MAYTVTKYKTVFGDHRVVAMNIVADAATQNVVTGLSIIDWMELGVKSLATMGIKVYPNSSATGVASPGTVGMSGLVSGDELYVTVYGR